MPNKYKLVSSFCVECSRPFSGRAVDVKRNRVKYCSASCRSKRVGRFYAVTSNPIKLLVSKHPKNRPFIIMSACVGNFSRSPLIQAVLNHHIKQNRLDGRVSVISGGISVVGGGTSINHELANQLDKSGIQFLPEPSKGISSQGLRSANLILTVTEEVQRVLVGRLEELYPQCPSAVGKAILFTSLTKIFGNDPNMVDPDCVNTEYRAETINLLLRQVNHVVRTIVIPALKPLAH